MSLIAVIGRGHSGTRVISHTLYASGVYMGNRLNHFGDFVPPQGIYKACRVMAKHVRWLGDFEWDFDKLRTIDVEPTFKRLVGKYLAPVLESTVEHRGWKLPETVLIYPWIARLFPESKYIFLVRNPRDCILKNHLTDDLGKFGIDCPSIPNARLRRAVSWKYQHDIVRATPKPKNWLEVRFEDFVLRQDETLARLEMFLGMKLAKIIVRPESVDRWKDDDGTSYYDFWAPGMRECGYEIPSETA